PKGEVTVDGTAGGSVEAPDLVVSGGIGGLHATIHVLAPDGTPVWGAILSRGPFSQSRTGADGRVTLEFQAPKAGAIPAQAYTVKAKGYAPSSVTATPSADGPELEVRLGPSHRVLGHVYAADRTPKAGASVTVANGAVAL